MTNANEKIQSEIIRNIESENYMEEVAYFMNNRVLTSVATQAINGSVEHPGESPTLWFSNNGECWNVGLHAISSVCAMPDILWHKGILGTSMLISATLKITDWWSVAIARAGSETEFKIPDIKMELRFDSTYDQITFSVNERGAIPVSETIQHQDPSIKFSSAFFADEFRIRIGSGFDLTEFHYKLQNQHWLSNRRNLRIGFQCPSSTAVYSFKASPLTFRSLADW
eukprot:GHVH01007558.1.p1 GENE.GHVH01007558.1~~GHVH01007558.1.p1  ORF type:complete len:226 (+),score=22.03 GHVH01007558.1:260-937(+)